MLPKIELLKPKVTLISPPKTYYPHFCYDCLFNYFGDEKDVVLKCPNCGGTNVTDYRGCGYVE